MKAKRKLFRKALLLQMVLDAYKGPVPIAAIRRKYNLDVSLPHLSKIIDLVNRFGNNKAIMASICPEWLNDDDDIQEEPEDYSYKGTFPWGTWEQRIE